MAKKPAPEAPNEDIRVMAVAFQSMAFNIDGEVVFDYIEFRDCVEAKSRLADKAVDAIMEKYGVVKEEGMFDYSKDTKSAEIDTEIQALLAHAQGLKPTHFLSKKQLIKLITGNPGHSDRVWKTFQKYLLKSE